MQRRTVRFAVGSGVLGLALSGCTTSAPDPSANPLPPSTSRPSTSPTSNASAGTSFSSPPPAPASGIDIPTSAQPQTLDGAQSFARFYIDELNKAMNSVDVTVLTALSTNSCKSCSSYNSIISTMKANHQHYEGIWLSPTSISLNSFESGFAKVEITVAQAGRIMSDSGGVVTTSPAQTGRLLLTLKSGQQWLVDEVQVIK